MNVPAAESPPADAAPPAANKTRTPPLWRNPWLWISFFLIGFSLWQWQASRNALGLTQAAFSSRIARLEAQLQEAKAQALQNREGIAGQGRRLDAAENGISRLEDEAAAARAKVQSGDAFKNILGNFINKKK
jgi:hypothetical protein